MHNNEDRIAVRKINIEVKPNDKLNDYAGISDNEHEGK